MDFPLISLFTYYSIEHCKWLATATFVSYNL